MGEDREELDRRAHLVLDHMERAPLRVAVVRVDAGPHHELALVGLADVDVDGVRHHDRVEHGLEQDGDQRLQRVGLQRQPQAEHGGQDARVPRGGERDLPRGSFRGSSRRPRHGRRPAQEPRHLGVLHDVDAELGSRASVPPATRSRRATPPRRCSVAPSTKCMSGGHVHDRQKAFTLRASATRRRPRSGGSRSRGASKNARPRGRGRGSPRPAG